MTKKKHGFKMKGFPLNPYAQAQKKVPDFLNPAKQIAAEEKGEPQVPAHEENAPENVEAGVPYKGFKMKGFPDNGENDPPVVEDTSGDASKLIGFDPETGSLSVGTSTTSPETVIPASTDEEATEEQLTAFKKRCIGPNGEKLVGKAGCSWDDEVIPGVTTIDWSAIDSGLQTPGTDPVDPVEAVDPVEGKDPILTDNTSVYRHRSNWNRQDINKRRTKKYARQGLRGIKRMEKQMEKGNLDDASILAHFQNQGLVPEDFKGTGTEFLNKRKQQLLAQKLSPDAGAEVLGEGGNVSNMFKNTTGTQFDKRHSVGSLNLNERLAGTDAVAGVTGSPGSPGTPGENITLENITSDQLKDWQTNDPAKLDAVKTKILGMEGGEDMWKKFSKKHGFGFRMTGFPKIYNNYKG